jgi:hypothetical protein
MDDNGADDPDQIGDALDRQKGVRRLLWERRVQHDLQFVIGRIGALAYGFLLTRDFATALAAADQAISLAPGEIWLYTNRAHALMLLGRFDEARALYLKYRGQKDVTNGKSWEVVVLEDFTELRKAGLTDPLMDSGSAAHRAVHGRGRTQDISNIAISDRRASMILRPR